MNSFLKILVRRGYFIACIGLLLLYGLLFYEIYQLEKNILPVTGVSSSLSTLKIITIISSVFILLIVFYFFIVNYRENRAKEKADLAAKNLSRQLQESISKLEHVNQELMDMKSIEKFASSGRLARTLAHEVRNPLTNISLASEQLKEMKVQSPDVELLVDMIGRNALRINHLVSEFLSSTRFAQLNYEESDINVIIDDALKLAVDRIELNHTRIEKHYANDVCPIRIDKEKIKLAFINIIVNAIEAMEKDSGILKITTSAKDGKCIVEFKDNGGGMPEEVLQKVFEPYYTTKPKGTGLGLTNTQNIIFNHGGSINVKSEPGGTTFIVMLNLEKGKMGN
jgi:signal transduction histidine kinase